MLAISSDGRRGYTANVGPGTVSVLDKDAFLVFLLFHIYRIVLSGRVHTDRPGVQEVAAHAQRGVSEAMASAWTGTSDERADPHFWYYRWNGDWGYYGHAEYLSPAEAERLGQLRAETDDLNDSWQKEHGGGLWI
jgi:hypothetical protein